MICELAKRFHPPIAIFKKNSTRLYKVSFLYNVANQDSSSKLSMQIRDVVLPHKLHIKMLPYIP